MKRLDAAVEALGETGDVRNLRYGNAGFVNDLPRAAGRENFKAQLDKSLGEIDDAGLKIVD